MYPIPANATRIRYLQSDGSANIKMLLPVGLSAGYAAMAVDMEFVSAPAATAGCGYFQSSNRLFAGRIASGTSYEMLAYRVRNKDCYSTTTSDAGRHRYYADTQTGAVTFDGSSIAASGTSGTITVPAVGVFGRTNNEGTAWESYGTPMRVYSFKFWKNGVLIYDLVPIRVGTTGAMFNRVTGDAIYNQSTGLFVLGPDTFSQGVVPTRMMPMGVRKKPYDAEVEYIESTGAQYVDTGWHPSSNGIRMRIRAESRGAPAGTAVSGAELLSVSARWVFVLYGQSTDSSKLFPLVGDWNNKNSGFTFVSGTVLDIDWSATATWTTIRDSESGVQFSHAFGEGIDFRQNTVSLRLFQNAVTQRAKIRLVRCQIYDNGTLVRDFAPVRVGTAGYLYDRANPTGGPLGNGLYGSATSTPLVAGPDKIPS